MKGTILLKALDILKDQAISQIDFFNAVLVSGYGASMSKIDYEYQKRRQIREGKKIRKNDLQDREIRLHRFISKMKHDGLIDKIGGSKAKFVISKLGKTKLNQLKNKLPGRNYKKKSQNNPIIVSFDIPERLRRKRNWIREVIKNLGFEMVHQSVWIGKTKIPKEMVEDLEKLNILEFVEIFEVGKRGTLKKLGKL